MIISTFGEWVLSSIFVYYTEVFLSWHVLQHSFRMKEEICGREGAVKVLFIILFAASLTHSLRKGAGCIQSATANMISKASVPPPCARHINNSGGFYGVKNKRQKFPTWLIALALVNLNTGLMSLWIFASRSSSITFGVGDAWKGMCGFLVIWNSCIFFR